MKKKVTREVLDRLKWYMSNASTRNEAYRNVSGEYHISVSTIRNAASKAGITSPMHSLHYILSDKEEQALVAFCIKYDNRNEPLTIPDIIASRTAALLILEDCVRATASTASTASTLAETASAISSDPSASSLLRRTAEAVQKRSSVQSHDQWNDQGGSQ